MPSIDPGDRRREGEALRDRVALIKTRYDMVPSRFSTESQQYAHFLSQELHFVYTGGCSW